MDFIFVGNTLLGSLIVIEKYNLLERFIRDINLLHVKKLPRT